MDQPKNNSFLFLGSILAAILLFLLDQVGFLNWYKDLHSFVTMPITFATKELSNGIGSSFYSFVYTSKLREENNNLKVKILELEKMTADQQALLDANKSTAETRDILNLLHYKKTVVAQILDATVNDLSGYLEINKGSSNGITVGKPAVVKDYYLGYVAEVTSNSAKIKTVEIAGQSMIGYVDKRKISGTIKTEIGKVYLDDLLANETVQLNDIVSVRRENMPYIFPLGTITSTPKDTGTAQRMGIITPYLRTSDISIVTVILE